MNNSDSIYKDFDELGLSDNFMFAAVMQDIDNCKSLLEIILGIKIVKISRPESEKFIKFTPSSKGVRFDVYVENEDTAYDIEMQATYDELPKRSRYYQGMMDRSSLKKGMSYENLCKGIIIFICSFDPFKHNLPIYTSENMCREDKNIVLGDETLKVFLNTKGKQDTLSQEMRNFYDLINIGIAKDDFTNKLIRDINSIKKDDMWRERYMEWNTFLYDTERLAEKRGKLIGKVELLISLDYSPEKIADTLDLPLDKINEIINSLHINA